MKALKVNMLSYEWLLQRSWDTPVFLVFGGIWDYDSRRMYQKAETLPQKYGDKLIAGIVDYDLVPEIFTDFEVAEIPTLMIIEDGKEFKRITKAECPSEVDSFLDYFFGVLPY